MLTSSSDVSASSNKVVVDMLGLDGGQETEAMGAGLSWVVTKCHAQLRGRVTAQSL
jgi:hypothetical protein